ncbi:hypothetical protein GW756_03660 [bacterium]|nr:hypothetical protein [bacterium]NCQ55384.1 hypothetical protein [Candidatus Parcubacteria bacterium]NCS67746.1 hypothetical protein [Candidatus Peregrinibacteria bacterium]NCS96440.1 hypothetical protein [bacterium]
MSKSKLEKPETKVRHSDLERYREEINDLAYFELGAEGDEIEALAMAFELKRAAIELKIKRAICHSAHLNIERLINQLEIANQSEIMLRLRRQKQRRIKNENPGDLPNFEELFQNLEQDVKQGEDADLVQIYRYVYQLIEADAFMYFISRKAPNDLTLPAIKFWLLFRQKIVDVDSQLI